MPPRIGEWAIQDCRASHDIIGVFGLFGRVAVGPQIALIERYGRGVRVSANEGTAVVMSRAAHRHVTSYCGLAWREAMPPIEETLPGLPSARMRDRTIDVESMELEVIDGPPHIARSWIGGGTLLAASVSLVVGTAAFFVLDEARLRSSSSSPDATSPRAASAPPLPSSQPSPTAKSPTLAAPAMGQGTSESGATSAPEAKPAPVSETVREPVKPLRKRIQTKRTRTVSSTSTRTVAKRIHRP